MNYNAPLSRGKARRLIEVMSPFVGRRVLDLGCGSGAFLRQLVEHSGCEGLGIDTDAAAIDRAREGAAKVGLRLKCRFRVEDVKAAKLDPEGFGGVVCIGATHAFAMGEGAYEAALRGILALLRPGGVALIGEGYWKQPPAEGYLALLGPEPGIYRDHKGNVDFAEGLGLVPLYAAVSSDDEWDDFEWSHRMRVERELAQRPGDPEALEKRARSRAWRDAYLRWGRCTMGFGYYIFQRLP